VAQASFSLLVLRTADLDRSVRFYRALGLSLVQEQHGQGPIHYSCTLDTLVLELYPAKPGSAPDRLSGGATLLGFRVDSLSAVLQALQAESVRLLSPPVQTSGRARAVVEDPDGRAVELREEAAGG
jgi:lactoylglutathione lyase